MKVNKSLAKRLKITKNGKIIARKPGKNHFNAKESGSVQMSGKRSQKITLKNKVISRFLPKVK